MLCLAIILHILFHQDHALFLLEPANSHFLATDVKHNPKIPSSILPAPLVSSPCLGVTEEIDLQAIGSPGC